MLCERQATSRHAPPEGVPGIQHESVDLALVLGRKTTALKGMKIKQVAKKPYTKILRIQ